MSLSRAVAPHLPFLRRYARALTGSQESGDTTVQKCLEAIVADLTKFEESPSPKVGLYRQFHDVLESDAVQSPQSRRALLLTALEDFSTDEVAEILGEEFSTISDLIATALEEISTQNATDVLIIEDEPIISLDLTGIVEGMGHRVIDVASTRQEAVSSAQVHAPGLVLADIQLADGSSGIEAVREILADIAAPIIFVTAFPDRLLTGERPEPTFLITKPFQPDTVRAAIGQALFFAGLAEQGLENT